MRILSAFIVVLLTPALLLSCSNCDNLDCITHETDMQMRIISENNNEDLLFGPNKVYSVKDLKFYSLKGNDTIHYPLRSIRSISITTYDSLISVYFYPNTTLAYLQLNNTDTDTLNMSFFQNRTKCCGNIARLSHFEHNQTAIDRTSYHTIEIRK